MKSFVCFAKPALLLLTLSFSMPGLSASVQKGAMLPELSISEGGAIEITADGKDHFRPWSSIELRNSKRIIQYLPGRLRSGKENLTLNAELYALDYPDRCRTVSIVNYTDAMWGTHMFITPEMTKNKKRTPKCDVVLDRKGLGLSLWGLKLKTNTTIVINGEGVVEFFHEGRLSKEQIAEVIRMTTPEGVSTKPDPGLAKNASFNEYF